MASYSNKTWEEVLEFTANLPTTDDIKQYNIDHNYKFRFTEEDIITFRKKTELFVGMTELDKLNIIHVTGTKGKGSTCAFTESILRASGFKTGFFSSPHLVDPRERIRINGQPISKEMFTRYLYTTHEQLAAKYDRNKTSFFRIFAIMAFRIFVEEKVDVAIVEVGIGGLFDPTNIVRTPVVTGISSLGLDHGNILGDTIDEVAWHKSGIFKFQRPAFTVRQPDEAMQTLLRRAGNLQTTVRCVPSIDEYDFQGRPVKLGLEGEHQGINASLAMQLCKTWLEDIHPEFIKFQDVKGDPNQNKLIKVGEDLTAPTVKINTWEMQIVPPFVVPEVFLQGLHDCFWPGRSQTYRRQGATHYLDGAHTPRSMRACIDWFLATAEKEANSLKGSVVRALIFNTTGGRNAEALISLLMECNFDVIAFCPNIATDSTCLSESTDTSRGMATCIENNTIYEQILLEKSSGCQQPAKNENAVRHFAGQLRQHACELTSTCGGSRRGRNNAVLSCVPRALRWVAGSKDTELGGTLNDGPAIPVSIQNAAHVQVLVTGSLYLVGKVIEVLNPDLVTKPIGRLE